MSPKEFAKEYLCDFVIGEKTQILRAIAQEYHAACDAYDALVCDKDIEGRSCPATCQQMAQVNRNARHVLKEIVCRYPALSRLDIIRAIQQYPRW